MSRYGVIIGLQGGQALVSTSRRGICESCADAHNCSFESALGKDVPEEVLADNPLNARPGDHVEFDLPGLGELKLSIIIWGAPILGLMAGAAAGFKLGASDAAAIIGAAIGLGAAFIPTVIYDRIAGRSRRHTPRIVRVLDRPC